MSRVTGSLLFVVGKLFNGWGGEMNFKSGGWTSLIGVLAAQARGLPDYFVLIAPAATQATPPAALVDWGEGCLV